jgi:predicted phage replisome organizer
MSGIHWIKISTDMFNDEKIRYIEQLPESDSILTIWVKLLVLAGQKNMGGQVYFNDELPYTDEMLSAIFHRKVNTVRLALETFSKLRMIEITADRTIIICNWCKHQNVDGLDKIRQQTLERKKRWRQKQLERRLAEPSGNVPLRSVERTNCVPLRSQNKNENREEDVPSCRPSLKEGQPANPNEFINDINEAKRLICERILNGKDPSRPWSEKAMSNLARQLPMPRLELERVAWFRGLPDDGSPELGTRKPVTENALTAFWSDEVTRAEAFWQLLYRWRQKKM